MERIATLSLATASLHLDPDREQGPKESSPEDHLLRSSIRRHGILEALQVCDDKDGYVIIDGERRYRLAKELGYDRLICVVHPYMSRESREELRMELKLTVAGVATGKAG